MTKKSKKRANRARREYLEELKEQERQEKLIRFQQAVQEIFAPKVLKIAIDTEFMERQRKVNALQWIQAAASTYTAHPQATMEQFSEKLKDLFGISISEKAVSKQFQKPEAHVFLKELISEAMSVSFWCSDTSLEIAKQFNGIYAGDCTSIALPKDLHDQFPGCGNQYDSATACLKMFFRFELFSGQYEETIIHSGRTSDHTFYGEARPLPAGALELLDMGFYSVDRFEGHNQAGVYWISRVPAGKKLTIDGQKTTFTEFLQGRKKKEKRIDIWVELGEKKFGCRLVAIRAPKHVIEQRTERWQEKNRGKKLSEDQLVIMQWTVYVTNLSQEQVSSQRIYDLYSLRWQVELVFKSWKSDMGLDKSNAKTGTRFLSELYIKFLMIVITNWLATTEGGPLNGTSPKKIRQKVRENFPEFFRALANGNVERMNEVILRIIRQIDEIRPQKRRRKHPTTRQTLENIRVNL